MTKLQALLAEQARRARVHAAVPDESQGQSPQAVQGLGQTREPDKSARIKALKAELARRERIKALKAELAKRKALQAEQPAIASSVPQDAQGQPLVEEPMVSPPTSMGPAVGNPQAPVVADKAEEVQQGGMLADALRFASGLTGAGDMAAAAQSLPQGVKDAAGVAAEASNAAYAPAAAEVMGGEQGAVTSIGEGVGRGVGAAVGGLVSAGFGAGVGAMIGGGIGAAIGSSANKLYKGEKVTPGGMALEFGLSVIPDAALAGVGKLYRTGQAAMSRTLGGRREAANQAGQYIRDRAEKMLTPPARQHVDEMFELVRKSGDSLNPVSFAKPVAELSDTQFGHVQQALRRIADPPGQDMKLGEAAADLFDAIRKGEFDKTTPMDLGTLQHIRSQVSKTAFSKQDGATKDALELFVDGIDKAIDSGSFMHGSGESVPLLKEAREAFRKLKETEDLTSWIQRNTKRLDDGKTFKINLGKMKDALDNPTNGVEERAIAALRRNPAGMKEFKEFLANMDKVDISANDIVSSFSVLNGFAAVLGAEPAARARFNRIVRANESRHGIKSISLSQLALLLNAGRRGPGGEKVGEILNSIQGGR